MYVTHKITQYDHYVYFWESYFLISGKSVIQFSRSLGWCNYNMKYTEGGGVVRFSWLI